MGDSVATSMFEGSQPKREPETSKTEPKGTSSLDFCVQRITSHGNLVAVYLKPSEEDIFDLLPRLIEYDSRNFKIPVSVLVQRAEKIFIKQYSLIPEYEDLLQNRHEFQKRNVTQWIFKYNRKREIQAAIEALR